MESQDEEISLDEEDLLFPSVETPSLVPDITQQKDSQTTNTIRTFFAPISSFLRTETRWLWLVLCLKFLDAFSYFLQASVWMLFLMEVVHFEEKTAGTLLGAFGGLTSLLGVFTGVVVHMLGLPNSLLLAILLNLCCRLITAYFRNQTIQLLVVILFLPLGISVSVPGLAFLVQLLVSDQKNKEIAFGLFYLMGGLGAVFSGITLQLVESMVHNHPLQSSWVMVIAAVVNVVQFSLTSIFYWKLEMATESAEEPDVDRFTWAHFKHSFSWNLLYFIILVLMLAPSRSVFRQMDLVLPVVLVRKHQKYSFGTYFTTNAIATLILVPLCSILLVGRSRIWVIFIGTIVSAIAPFFMTVPVDEVNFLFVLLLSLGEALWAPKLYDIVTEFAPKGQESPFYAWAWIPMGLGKLLAGSMSGTLTQTFCPSESECSTSWIIWIITGVLGWLSPILIGCYILICFLKQKKGDIAISLNL